MVVRRNSARYVGSTEASFAKALQPWTFPASLAPFIVGTLLAWKFDQHFRLAIFGFNAATVILTHAAGNFVNSYYEFKDRGFFARPSTRRRLLLDASRFAVWSCFLAFCSFIGLLMVSEANWKHQLWFFAAGFVFSLLYGTGLRSNIAGEVIAGISFGPLTVMFTYHVQAAAGVHTISPLNLVVFSLPLVFNTEAILHSQNTRDLLQDREGGATTLAVILGPNYACVFYCFFLLIPHVVLVAMAIVFKSFYLLVPVISLPIVFGLQVVCSEGDHSDLPQKTAGFSFLFSMLYVIGLCLAF